MKEIKEKRSLILVRHAHRDVSDRSLDNGLSEKGQIQAHLIRSYYLAKYGEVAPKLFSSRKRRCVETLEPLSQLLGVKTLIEPLLLEQTEGESMSRFLARLQSFKEKSLKSKEKIILACSHGDWIPEAISLWTGKTISTPKGSWSEFVLNSEGQWEWVGIQIPK